MSTPGFALFETPIGRCAIVWSERGVRGVQLPERNEAATRARLARTHPDVRESAPPPEIERAIQAILALLRGEARDLSDVALDLDGVPPFHRRVYALARKIPPGATLSYGELARRIGAPGSARAVGQALGRNPFAIVVPCHRVLAAGGKMGGFSANGGVSTKLRLLTIEREEEQLPLFAGGGKLGFDAAEAVAHLRSQDAELGRWIDAVGPFNLKPRASGSLFDALAEAIVYQQLNGKAAAAIFARVRALFPNPHQGLTVERFLRAPEEKLRAAGLSQGKLASLRDLASRAAAGELPTLDDALTLSDDALVERLTVVRGIGRWTVEMLLIFRLGRPDVLPVDDYGVRKGFSVVHRTGELPTPKELERFGARFGPYRTAASWYYWRAAERDGSPEPKM